MSNMRTYNRSFAGGEISPEMFGRIDDSKFQMGAALMRNFIATPQGAAENRAGFAFVKATKNDGIARLIPFTYSTTQTMVIEIGAGYFRFHTQGETLEYGNVQPAFVPNDENVSISVASPCVVTWPAHGMSDGAPVSFYADTNAGGGVHVVGPLPAGLSDALTYSVSRIDNDTFRLLDPTTGLLANMTAPATLTIHGFYHYPVGALVSYSGAIYYCAIDSRTLTPQVGSNAQWYQLPSDLTYEIPNHYSVNDLFGIHYVQSADVLTLVHPNYPPAELRRLGATDWTLTNVAFGAAIAAPASCAAAATPGYTAQIDNITLGTPALLTTRSNHTLSLGDSIYIGDLIPPISGTPTDLSGFYLVEKVPVDGSGNLILNELQVMDYSGNTLDSSAWDSYPGGATIQLGAQIFDLTNHYAVTAIAQNGIDESPVSSDASALNNLDVTGSFNTITWAAVPGALRYQVYKKLNGLYGYIGQATGTSFVDTNIGPDMGVTPPNYETDFAAAGDYPGAVTYFEQRRCFAGSLNAPDNIVMTNSGTESAISYSLPVKDTDRIAFRVAAREANTIQHLVPLASLILLTSATEYAVQPVNSDAITPTSIGVKPQAYVGASSVQPDIINNSLIYCAARGGHVYGLGYAWQASGFIAQDLSLKSAHLFDNLTIVDQCFSKSPRPIAWFVSSNGMLLGATYLPPQQPGLTYLSEDQVAWHGHTTDGIFESIACVAEGNEDRLYAVIRRTVNNVTVRYIERMASRQFTDIKDCFFVDAGLTYDGTAATVISGLDHLEGKTVAILADGGVVAQQVVSSGAITLPHAASKVQIGLPIIADLQTLPLVLQIDGFGQGRTININKCWLRVRQSSGIWIGPDVNSLRQAKQRTTEPWGSPPSLKDGVLEALSEPSWQQSGQVFIRQQDPLPLSVVSLTMEVAIGG